MVHPPAHCSASPTPSQVVPAPAPAPAPFAPSANRQTNHLRERSLAHDPPVPNHISPPPLRPEPRPCGNLRLSLPAAHQHLFTTDGNVYRARGNGTATAKRDKSERAETSSRHDRRGGQTRVSIDQNETASTTLHRAAALSRVVPAIEHDSDRDRATDDDSTAPFAAIVTTRISSPSAGGQAAPTWCCSMRWRLRRIPDRLF